MRAAARDLLLEVTRPLKLRRYAIPLLGVIAAVAVGVPAGYWLNGPSEPSAASAEHAACKGFRQWQSSHDPATLRSAVNNLDSWVQATQYHVGKGDNAWLNADGLDTDMGELLLVVQDHVQIESLSTATQQVVSDCKGN